jgi:seryl-tRNA synthetase
VQPESYPTHKEEKVKKAKKVRRSNRKNGQAKERRFLKLLEKRRALKHQMGNLERRSRTVEAQISAALK